MFLCSKILFGRSNKSDFSQKSDLLLRDKTKFDEPLRKSSYLSPRREEFAFPLRFASWREILASP